MDNRTEFEMTEDHLTLLRNSYVRDDLSDIEYGSAWIDPKRPYGSSAVEKSIAKLLGIELIDGEHLRGPDRARCRKLHEDTPMALQIVLVTGTFKPGVYRRPDPYDKKWELVER